MHQRGTNETTPKTGMVLQVEATDIFSLLIFSDCFSLVFQLARVSVTTGSMRRYLDPTEAAQAVQLLQDGTSIRTIARRFAVSPSIVARAGQGCRRLVVAHWIDYRNG